MAEFKAERGALRREARISLALWAAYLALFAGAGLLLRMRASGDLAANPGAVALFLTLLLTAILGASVLACREALHAAEHQMSFVLDDSGVVLRRRGHPDVKISFSEMRSVSEEFGRLIIRTGEPVKKIAAPPTVGGYEIIRTELQRRIALPSRRGFPFRMPALLAISVLSWVVLFWSGSTVIAVTAAIVGLALVASGSRHLLRLRRNGSRTLSTASVGFAWLVAFLLIYIRFTAR